MSSSIRVLQAVIAVSVGVAAFKGIDLAQAIAQSVEADATTGPAETPAEGAIAEGFGSEEAPPAAADPTVCLPSLDYTAETGISEQEILVLRSLAERRDALDVREAGIETREQAAAAAESRLAEQIAELKAVEAEVQKILASMETRRDERMDSLVKTYEAMKPKDAARIFDGMDNQILVDLSRSMKPATLAAIMSSMDSKRAETLTRLLADLAKPPAEIPALARTSG